MIVWPEMPLTQRDNGVSMGGTLREVSTLKKMLHFGGLKRPAKLVCSLCASTGRSILSLRVLSKDPILVGTIKAGGLNSNKWRKQGEGDGCAQGTLLEAHGYTWSQLILLSCKSYLYCRIFQPNAKSWWWRLDLLVATTVYYASYTRRILRLNSKEFTFSLMIPL